MSDSTADLYSRWAADLDEKALRPQRLTLAPTPSGPIFVRKGDIIGDNVIAHQRWDYLISKLITEEVPGHGTAVDVGAHFGVLSCLMAAKFEKVVSLEPNFDSFRILVLNSLTRPNMIPINMCIYDRKTSLSLSKPEEQDIEIPRDDHGNLDFVNTHNVGSYSFSETGTGINSVQSTRIDDLDLERVSFIKVDAQGADGRVIFSGRATIEKFRPIVIFEWEKHLAANYGISFDEVTDFFAHHRYQVDLIRARDDIQSDHIARPL